MESPVRKMLKRNDYNRHKLLRKIKRRRKTAAEQQSHAAEKELRRKMKMPKFDPGKDEFLRYELNNPNQARLNGETGDWQVLDENGNPIVNNGGYMLPNLTVRPSAPQTSNSADYFNWLMRESNRGGANFNTSDKLMYNSIMSKLANQNEIHNFVGYDGKIHHHGNGALETVSPEFDVLTMSPLFKNIGKGIYDLTSRGLNNVNKKLILPTLFSTMLDVDRIMTKLPTNIHHNPKPFWSRDIETNQIFRASDRTPFLNFIDTKRGADTKSYFMRAPKNVDVLQIGNGRYGAKAEGNTIISGGEVPGKFVSYGEPWREFDVGENSAFYEFPIGSRRGPSLMATDWRGNRKNISVDEMYDFIRNKKSIRLAFETEKEKFMKLPYFERIKAIDNLIRTKYPQIKWDASIYGGNQTVIPNERWNFDKFLKEPFWRYTEDPISGLVLKELIISGKPNTTNVQNAHDTYIYK